MKRNISYDEIKKLYLDFFKSKNHAVIKSSSLIPENDSTVLFTTAGMHPLVPYLLGEKHPSGKRLTDVQKCLRTGDIDEVGDMSHLTFFEMLGNWSLGDYFKEESISMSYEFLTKVLQINPKNIAVTVFAGDNGIKRDNETYKIWKEKGLDDSQIFFYGKDDNWWGPAGMTGPCGPDTEIFIDNGQEKCSENCGPACHCGKYTEIWNNVFMEYNKNKDGSLSLLFQKNVDTGMGVERILAFLNNNQDVYKTELFEGVIDELEKLSPYSYEEKTKEFRKIADHIRTATFILGDEKAAVPSNTEQGYVLRRIIRSCIRNLKKIDVNESVLPNLSQIVIDKYGSSYPELIENRTTIINELQKEENLFNKTIYKGIKEFNKIAEKNKNNNIIDGNSAFRLYDTFGFPIEFTIEMAVENNMSVDVDGFLNCFKEHQEKSRRGSAGKFKSGLADNSEETTKLHTATHLLHAALRIALGKEINQKGSNITPERLRFDFNFDRKLTEEEKNKVENIVNDIINMQLPVICEEMTYAEAKKSGAIGVYQSKSDNEKVKVYSIGEFSKEICSGPHVKNTGELGHFKIDKECSSSSGVRRIKATCSQYEKENGNQIVKKRGKI